MQTEILLVVSAVAGSQTLLEDVVDASSHGVDRDRLALLERQAPAFVILDFR